ncbi:MAG: type II toxin-antitoxin system RelE/ParE family toxin [Planctomycetota bacterium]
MPRRLTHDRAAASDLIQVWIYSFETWGEAQADRYLRVIETGIRDIARDPTTGRNRDAIRPGYWSVRIAHHVVFYTVNNDELRVRRVLHEAMDFESHL